MADHDRLRPLRWWQVPVHGRFELERNGSTYTVDSSYIDLDEQIRLYRDGDLIDSTRRKARFVLDEGTRIEAAVSQLGMKYVRARAPGATVTEQLVPAAGTGEAWRARIDHDHPWASRLIGAVALTVLIIAALVELPQLINLAGRLTPVVGLPAFEIPAITLTGWVNVLVIIVGGIAGLERGLSMKHNPLIDD
ncbi:MAG: hypothetical protein L0G99_02950 [Propionibacteriales bacterium]|nr:hypothetical protein [Propionibacteriales bacterium]